MDKESAERDQLIELGELIDSDLEFLTNKQDRGAGRGRRIGGTQHDRNAFGDQQETFARLLANVAKHSIGFRASVIPLNESPESILAYLMDLFRLNQDEIETLLMDTKDRGKAEEIQSDLNPVKNQSYTFRPELRLRLNPLIMSKLQDLLVKVYLTNGEKPKQVSKVSSIPSENSQESRGLSELFRIWGSSKQSPQSFSKNLLAEIKFTIDGDEYEPEVTCLNRDLASSSGSSVGELKIRLRSSQQRFSNQIVQLVSTFNNSNSPNAGSIKGLFKLSTCCSHYISRSEATNPPVYEPTNIKVSQIPAYATKLNQSITSEHDQEVDICDIIVELRNSDLVSGPSWHENILNHARLYSICIAYQLKLLSRNKVTTSPSYFRTAQTNRASPNLDSILSPPALSLINQHRLQSNISQLEDQSLRRSAILLLLTRLAQPKNAKTYSKSHQIFLVYIAEHEYLGAHRHFNNTTRQEVDPFNPKLELDNSHDQVKTLELSAIQTLTTTFICERYIEDWISGTDSSSSKPGIMEFLANLRLIRTILTHSESNTSVDQRFKAQSTQLRIQINQMLTKVLSERLQSKLNAVLFALNTSRDERQTRRKAIKSKLGNSNLPEENTQINPWQKLFSDIQLIENDMTLHWSDRGLESTDLDRTRLREVDSVIRNKVADYLTNK